MSETQPTLPTATSRPEPAPEPGPAQDPGRQATAGADEAARAALADRARQIGISLDEVDPGTAVLAPTTEVARPSLANVTSVDPRPTFVASRQLEVAEAGSAVPSTVKPDDKIPTLVRAVETLISVTIASRDTGTSVANAVSDSVRLAHEAGSASTNEGTLLRRAITATTPDDAEAWLRVREKFLQQEQKAELLDHKLWVARSKLDQSVARSRREFTFRYTMSVAAVAGGVALVLCHADQAGYLMLGAGLYNLAPRAISSMFRRGKR